LPFASIVTAAALVAILLVYLVMFQVRFSEKVVRVRFGKPVEVIDKPGPYMKWPAPIETIKTYDTRLRVLDTPETELKTQDGQNLIIGCYAIWQIDDVQQFHVRVGGERDAEEKLRTRINEARNSVLGQHSMSDLVNLDSALVAESHKQIYKEIQDTAGPGLRSDYGIKLLSVGIRRISVPEETTQAIQAAMAGERNAEATKYTEQGKALAATIKAKAESSANKIRDFAKARAQAIESAGALAAAQILERIKGEDSEFFIWLRYLEALQVALKQKTTIILDSEDDLFAPFHKPLGDGTDAPAAPARQRERETPQSRVEQQDRESTQK
jgi:membrane protease subunit HflC